MSAVLGCKTPSKHPFGASYLTPQRQQDTTLDMLQTSILTRRCYTQADAADIILPRFAGTNEVIGFGIILSDNTNPVRTRVRQVLT